MPDDKKLDLNDPEFKKKVSSGLVSFVRKRLREIQALYDAGCPPPLSPIPDSVLNDEDTTGN